ncbi:olfactory receptor 1496-like [Polypterus senegalus]|uniref:olfactory receptor 1496-like n=1 Tax=Polypterus senegalus TaxID=55291 RepID=UPI00196354BB|nr:olfactory receptor 1496-like [Polypterus senegalus]
MDYQSDRPQFVSHKDCASNTGAPQGTVLSPLLFTLYTKGYKHNRSCHLEKFLEDSALMGCLDKRDETEEMSQRENFDSCLHLNITKSKGLVFDFRHTKQPLCPVAIPGEDAEVILSSGMMNNNTVIVSEFILHCAIDSQQRSQTVSVLIFIYFVTLFGNTLVILVIKSNRHLQTPMYLFIGTLAFFDLLNSSNVNPKMVAVILDSSVILYGLCFFQMILRCHLEMSESFLFALMACDRYVAVVYPLRYPTLITNKVVWMGILLLNITSIVLLLPYMFFAAELSFCRGNVLPYCFCDYVTMVHVSCNEDPKYLLTLSSTVTMVGIVPLTIILFSYIRIVKAALKISSVDGKRKVFSTCLTHLIVMGLFYFPLLVSYGLPGIGVRLSNEAYSVMVIIANVVPPMMNPIIYSFRNHDIKMSILKLFISKNVSRFR